MELDPLMQLDLLDEMRSMFREARLARAGAWCSLACIPGAGYLAGAALFGYPVAATPLVVLGILLPFGLGALLASSLIAVAAFRSAIALDRSGTPELPQPLVGGSLRRHPRVGLAVAVGAVFLAIVALRSARVTHFPPPAHAPTSAWLSPVTDLVIAAMLVLDARRRMPARRRAFEGLLAAAIACDAFGWSAGVAAGWLLIALLALWEVRDGHRELASTHPR
jgi:hypothetical protein